MFVDFQLIFAHVQVSNAGAKDIPLFLGITGDLFPGTKWAHPAPAPTFLARLPPSDYGKLINELEGAARARHLQPKATEAPLDGCASRPRSSTSAPSFGRPSWLGTASWWWVRWPKKGKDLKNQRGMNVSGKTEAEPSAILRGTPSRLAFSR